ncbi:MAG: RNA polymerase sigma factor [Lachnospiraceae bacterium]|jgi:RNA polymerase sigma factor (sigma-70 family)|nr:RNA polymerase sigma factor [Lachnospiraceae bacterium]
MKSKEDQFRAVYTAHVSLIRLIAKNKGIPTDEIDDLVQETFTAYFSHYPVDWPEYKVRATLMKIMKNRCIDYYRSQGSHPVTYYDPAIIQDASLINEKSFGRDSLSILLERQEYEAVMEALKSMKKEWLIVFVLHVIEGRPMTEVSKILGVRADTCRARLARGRNHLRKCLCPEAPEKYRPTGRNKTSPMVNMRKTQGIPEGT